MAKARVFLVDGDPAVRDSLTTLMDLNGFRVHAFSTGSAFINALPEFELVQCIICEAELPDTTGLQVFHELREARIIRPFALLVSERNLATREAAKAAGITSIFQKPLVHRNLLRFVSSAGLGENTD